MRMRDTIEVALLLAIGYVLHLVVPPLVLGMKPDLLLGMLFIILLMKRDFKIGIQAGVIAGILTALTTGFPGGQIPNIIDKILTSLFVMALIKLLADRISDKIAAGIIGILGTLFSGAVFLGSALILVGLPGPFKVLFTSVVLPATVANTIAVVILYPVVMYSRRVVVSRQVQSLPKS